MRTCRRPCKALSGKPPDISFTVIVNARCRRESNIAAYWHEIGHLERDDLDSGDLTDQIKAEAHKK